MTNEELNTRLYEKMFAEQEQFRDWLLSQPPAEILNHAYEYTMREDIVMEEGGVCGNVTIYGGKVQIPLAFLHLL